MLRFEGADREMGTRRRIILADRGFGIHDFVKKDDEGGEGDRGMRRDVSSAR